MRAQGVGPYPPGGPESTRSLYKCQCCFFSSWPYHSAIYHRRISETALDSFSIFCFSIANNTGDFSGNDRRGGYLFNLLYSSWIFLSGSFHLCWLRKSLYILSVAVRDVWERREGNYRAMNKYTYLDNFVIRLVLSVILHHVWMIQWNLRESVGNFLDGSNMVLIDRPCFRFACHLLLESIRHDSFVQAIRLFIGTLPESKTQFRHSSRHFAWLGAIMQQKTTEPNTSFIVIRRQLWRTV